MTLREQLIRVATLFGEAKGLDPGPVSRLAFSDGKTLPRLLAGGDVTTGIFERAMALFAHHWPADLDWPSDIPRPPPATSDVDASPASEALSSLEVTA